MFPFLTHITVRLGLLFLVFDFEDGHLLSALKRVALAGDDRVGLFEDDPVGPSQQLVREHAVDGAGPVALDADDGRLDRLGDALGAGRTVYDAIGEWVLRQTVERLEEFATA